ncbi:MAG: YjaG family protein [Proteobacteria bacterium]|nr:YjaG family protein [Pseudomonadota bacterium]
MEKEFDHGEVLQRLKRLSFLSALAFLLSCAERLYPNYLAFLRHHGWGNADAIRESLDLGWTVLEGGNVDGDRIDDVRSRCQDAEPDTEHFDSVYVSPALDAASVAGILLDFIRAKDVNSVAEAASLCRDTVDMYIQELESMDANAPDLEARILAHPLMQRELARQRGDIERLSEYVETLDVESLKSDWRSPSTSNIGLPTTG